MYIQMTVCVSPLPDLKIILVQFLDPNIIYNLVRYDFNKYKFIQFKIELIPIYQIVIQKKIIPMNVLFIEEMSRA